MWGDSDAVATGHELYDRYCIVCHGVNGRGDGVVADDLQHQPADLTRHLHSKVANNDSYLYWRVTEGGTAEPFRSQNSAMPPFGEVLTPKQRWQVLAYVHEAFHEGFIEEDGSQQAANAPRDSSHDESGH